MIEVTDLSKLYGDKTAVDHLDFTVRPRELSPGSWARTAPGNPPPCG